MKWPDRLAAPRGWIFEAVAVAIAVASTQALFDAAAMPSVGHEAAQLAIRILCILAIDRIAMGVLQIFVPGRERQ